MKNPMDDKKFQHFTLVAEVTHNLAGLNFLPPEETEQWQADELITECRKFILRNSNG